MISTPLAACPAETAKAQLAPKDRPFVRFESQQCSFNFSPSTRVIPRAELARGICFSSAAFETHLLRSRQFHVPTHWLIARLHVRPVFRMMIRIHDREDCVMHVSVLRSSGHINKI